MEFCLGDLLFSVCSHDHCLVQALESAANGHRGDRVSCDVHPGTANGKL